MATIVYGDFEWDDTKADANRAKHGVTFEEATSVFSDPCYILQQDAALLERFHAIGRSGLLRVLTVVHVERGARVRLISARPATATETRMYDRRRF